MEDHAEQGDQRKSVRASVRLDGKIYLANGAAITCLIKDLSAGGARLEVQENVKLPQTFDLVIFEAKFRVCRSVLRWRAGKLAGVAFVDPKSAKANVLPPVEP